MVMTLTVRIEPASAPASKTARENVRNLLDGAVEMGYIAGYEIVDADEREHD